MAENEDNNKRLADVFDRLLGGLHGLPDVTHTKPTTIRAVVPLLGASQTFIVQTYRQTGAGDTIFLEWMSAEGSFRLAIPPKVADVIARQREALGTAVRKKIAKAAAQERKERGELPGFMLHKKPGGKKTGTE